LIIGYLHEFKVYVPKLDVCALRIKWIENDYILCRMVGFTRKIIDNLIRPVLKELSL